MANVGQQQSRQRAENPHQRMTLDEKYNLLIGLSFIASVWAELFLAFGFGSRRHGVWTLASIFVGFLWIAHSEPLQAPYFFYACFAALVVQAFLRSPEAHSNSMGRRLVTALFGIRDFELWEILLLMGTGVLFHAKGHPGYGWWLMVTAIGHALCLAHINTSNKAVARARRDAMIEMRQQQERFQQAAAPPRSRGSRAPALLLIGVAFAAYMVHAGHLTLPPQVERYLPDWIKPTIQRRAVRHYPRPARREVYGLKLDD